MSIYKKIKSEILLKMTKEERFFNKVKKTNLRSAATLEEKTSLSILFLSGLMIIVGSTSYVGLDPIIIDYIQSFSIGVGAFGMLNSMRSLIKSKRIEAAIDSGNCENIEKELTKFIFKNETILTTENNKYYFILKEVLKESNYNKEDMEDVFKKLLKEIGKDKLKSIMNDPDLLRLQKEGEIGNTFYLFMLIILIEQNELNSNKEINKKITSYIKENFKEINMKDLNRIMSSLSMNKLLNNKKINLKNKKTKEKIANIIKDNMNFKNIIDDKMLFEQEYVLNLLEDNKVIDQKNWSFKIKTEKTKVEEVKV